MQVEEFDGSKEQEALLLCVRTTPFLSKLVGRVGKEPFRAKGSNLIWQWCEEYFAKYQQAPDQEVVSLFKEWARRSRKDEATHQIMDRLLSWILKQELPKSLNLEHALDRVQDHLNDVRLEKHQEEVKQHRERGQVDAALKATQNFVKLDLKAAPYTDILRDFGAYQQALESSNKVLVKYPGPAGEFFGNELAENSFVAFMAAAKGGKSYALLDIAWRACKQGRKVAYFQVGDLSRDQVMLRFGRRAAYRPLLPKLIRKPIGITIPSGSRELAVVEYEQKEYTTALTREQIEKAIKKAQKKSGGEFRLSYHPIKTASVVEIKNVLDSWDQTGYVAKVVVVDYAGNLAHCAGREYDSIQQVAHTWAMLRQLSEVRKCLVVTANQSNKEGYSSWVLTRKHFADSKMILAHVTAFLGVNMTDEEKQRGVLRYNFVVRREEEFSESYCLYCGSYLAAADPVAVSCLPSSAKG